MYYYEPSMICMQVSGRSDKTYLRGEESRVTPKQIEQSVNDSLSRLGTDYVDLLQVHWPDRYCNTC